MSGKVRFSALALSSEIEKLTVIPGALQSVDGDCRAVSRTASIRRAGAKPSGSSGDGYRRGGNPAVTFELPRRRCHALFRLRAPLVRAVHVIRRALFKVIVGWVVSEGSA